jgi:hypothetical protein
LVEKTFIRAHFRHSRILPTDRLFVKLNAKPPFRW